MVMIRPRTGDFLYTPHELSVMLEDIRAFAEIGITGVVFGALCADGKVDMEKTEILTEEAVKYNLQVCIHRAFDMVVDQKDSLHTLSTILGITRILTSGGKPTVSEGLASLVNLCTSLENQNRTLESSTTLTSPSSLPQRQTRLEIMPGSGLNAHTLPPILYILRPFISSGIIRSIHMSGGSFVESGVLHRPEGMGMGVGDAGEWGIWRTNEEKVRAVREVVDKMWEEIVKEHRVKSE
ncbi:uncharacterized protein FOMMEDRAFT_149095 [Fomitiporia mediterranea MF3/22]|uniref:uncharacterized protein n=1 Tax=Fomitiporia mediterranea (strain MF3/22) TaxID=694068 RepID=UPI0004408676|nr:uncharacterized protein FOMMEDRAFT_149095 [Fomitiporia mediterranea MF3/22]EJC98739.1 hypothetical protein FOMMEDRAFT_149095 [Fomitiporia mediterranea MF3/22]